jgi:hypothetical protein
MSCELQHTKKYLERPSPPYPAQTCPGQRKIGNDGRIWESVGNAKGIFRWVARTRHTVTAKTPRKSKSPSKSKRTSPRKSKSKKKVNKSSKKK